MTEKSVFQSQLEDQEVFRSLRKSGAMEELLTSLRTEMPGDTAETVDAGDLEDALERLRDGDTDLADPETAEAIVMLTGYPSLLVRGGTFEEPKEEVWRRRLLPNRTGIDRVIGATGRVDLENHPDYKWVGTSWLIDEETVVTNRHVAKIFADMRNGGANIRSGIKVRIDLKEEHGSTEQREMLVRSIVHIEASGPDLAFLRLERGAASRMGITPVTLSTRPLTRVDTLAVCGYPARDPRNPSEAMDRIFKQNYNVKRLAPGRVMQPSSDGVFFRHNCTTLGGNSGSAVFDVETGAAIGLHYSGSALTENRAVRADHILDRARRHSIRVRTIDGRDGDSYATAGQGGGDGDGEAGARAKRFDDRDGYRDDFIGSGPLSVPLPVLNPVQATKVARTKDGGTVLKYRHFSVVMNEERRLAYIAAVNIDGATSFNVRGRTPFILDPRLKPDQQVGNRLYADNDFDRGHLVRRLDPCWGAAEHVKQANRDSMFFPNIAPQHKKLNQKLWLDLENHILSRTDLLDAKVSVFVGCVFDERDPVQKPTGLKVPMGFWKVVVSAVQGRNRGRRGPLKLEAQAFVMWQHELVKQKDLEIVFGEGFTSQVSVEALGRLTGLDFHKLVEADTFKLSPQEREAALEGVSGDEAVFDSVSDGNHFRRLESLDDIQC